MVKKLEIPWQADGKVLESKSEGNKDPLASLTALAKYNCATWASTSESPR